MLLHNKVCLITGAASMRSIGYAAAEAFCAQGARLALLDIRMDEASIRDISAGLASRTGRTPDFLGVRCDIASPADCAAAVERVVDHFGTLDVLVNSAGVVNGDAFLAIEQSSLDLMLNVNFKGTFNLCQSAVKVFEARGAGAIVNIASVAAERGGGLMGGAHYASSKGAVISLTRTIAREFGHRGIRANVVCPSMTDTNMVDGKLSKERIEQIAETVPLGRVARPDEIANACLFLASDLASYITGVTLDVNGGSHIH